MSRWQSFGDTAEGVGGEGGSQAACEGTQWKTTSSGVGASNPAKWTSRIQCYKVDSGGLELNEERWNAAVTHPFPPPSSSSPKKSYT